MTRYLNWSGSQSVFSMGQFPRVNSVATLQYPTSYSTRATVTDIRPGPIRLQYPRATVLRCYSTGPTLFLPSATVPARHCSHGLLQSSPLRTRRPRRVPDQSKYQDLLSWPRPIRLVLTVPCTTSVHPVPTVPVRRPCLARARAHARALLPACGVKPRESALISLCNDPAQDNG